MVEKTYILKKDANLLLKIHYGSNGFFKVLSIDFRVIKSEKIDDRQLILVVLDIELNRALDELF